MISVDQQVMCERLYKEGKLKIKEIMAVTGIRSEQTVYRILDAAGIPRRPTRGTVMKATISMDKETVDVINRVNPKNLSEWICDLIKRSNKEALEGSSDDDYKKCADEAINKLESISRKYHLAREKANELNEAKRYIRSRNGYMPPAKLDKMARLLVKKTKEHENGNTEEKQL